MNGFQQRSSFGDMPIIVKNLLIVNGLFFLASLAVPSLSRILGAFYYDSPLFESWQIATHMFMHGGFMHIFFNMFALWIFGTAIERVWGPQRFLIYYLITGFGAFALHYAIVSYEAQQLIAELGPQAVETIKTQGMELWANQRNYSDPKMAQALNGRRG
jgi:rhomboid-like protein